MVNKYVNNKDKLFDGKDIHGNPTKQTKKVVICNEGASRSSKTYDTYHLLYYICSKNINRGLKIFVLRSTLKDCRDIAYKEDFVGCMKIIGAYNPKYERNVNQTPEYNLFGNTITFKGVADEKNAEGYKSDIVFCNEMLDIPSFSYISGIYMRCEKLFISDWNPKYTQHWAFDLESQENVFFSRTNYLNNKHLSSNVKSGLEALNPWEEGSYDIKDGDVYYKGKLVTKNHQPPPNIKNVRNKTANEFRFRVYALGLRGSIDGAIFENVVYDDEFPEIGYSYGMDFGFTNDPTAIVKCAETETDIYLQLMFYTPVADADSLNDVMNSLGIEKDVPITADSSDRYVTEGRGTVNMVMDLRKKGWKISKVSKTKGIVYWINSMNRKTIHIIKGNDRLWEKAKLERENYIWKTIDGHKIHQPIDKFNHFWDAARYRHMSYNKPVINIQSNWK